MKMETVRRQQQIQDNLLFFQSQRRVNALQSHLNSPFIWYVIYFLFIHLQIHFTHSDCIWYVTKMLVIDQK